MKAVVHIGVSKAGSTTIQETTFAHRAALLRCGVLVPMQDGRFIRPVDLADAVTGKRPTFRSEEVRSVIADGIFRHRPRALLLSSEYLYHQRDAVQELEAFLAPWTDDINVVLYVREPVGRYLSLCQQSLKGQYRFIGPAIWRGKYRPIVERWRQQYGDRLTVLPFQRSAFPEGLVNNFVARFFPDIAEGLPDLDDRLANKSDPSEVTQLLETYFKVLYPDAPRERRADVNRLRRYLVQTAVEIGIGKKPRLRPEVRATLAHNHAEDIAWLAAEEGIVFDGFEPGAINGEAVPLAKIDRVTWSDIVDVDAGGVENLAIHAVRRAAVTIDELERSWTWRLTSPLRKLAALWRGFLNDAPSQKLAGGPTGDDTESNS